MIESQLILKYYRINFKFGINVHFLNFLFYYLCANTIFVNFITDCYFLIPTYIDLYHYLYDSLLDVGMVSYCSSIMPGGRSLGQLGPGAPRLLRAQTATYPKAQTKEEFFKNFPKYAIKFYGNAKAEHKNILTENKGKSGIYLWYNCITLNYYIGQSKNLGDVKGGRLARYFSQSYLKSTVRGESLIRKALLKYGLENFSVLILEYCSIDLLDKREQTWIDLLEPYYNILKLVKSSRGYKHTEESLSKMRGPRPNFKPKPEHLAKLGFLAQNRVYDKTFRNAISDRLGFTVYVYDTNGKLINTYPSITKFKEAHGIKLHHKTLYKNISQGTPINGLKITLSPLQSNQSSSIVSIKNNKLKPRKIQLTNIVKPELSQTFESLSASHCGCLYKGGWR
uniref:GIY-YIG homing endonuclease n=1 Tax=Phanerochaete carnosa TaxID=231932 RepID=A0A895KV04_9APHY|nr:GIY-YIG homing endonuclease [Phanerochaete carnosa]QRZ60342.1 GIY-YIG homing endonuclease [Phanerochaete carnosa]